MTITLVSLTGRARLRSARVTACNAVAPGSVRAARVLSRSSGTGMRLRSGMAIRSAKAPGRYMPMRSRSGQRFCRPPRQYSQLPQVMSGFSTTRLPGSVPTCTRPTAS